MRYAILTLVLALGGCEYAAETLIEKATGIEIERDGETVTIKTKDGEITTTTNKDGAEMVITTSEGGKMVYSADNKNIRMQTKDGTVEIGGTEVPEDFPLPVPDDIKIISSARITKKGTSFHLTFMTDKSPAALAEMYQEAIEAKGLKVKRKEMKTGSSTMINLNARKKKLRVSASFVQDGDGKTQAMLSWQE